MNSTEIGFRTKKELLAEIAARIELGQVCTARKEDGRYILTYEG